MIGAVIFRFIVHIIMCHDSELVICDGHKFCSVYTEKVTKNLYREMSI